MKKNKPVIVREYVRGGTVKKIHLHKTKLEVLWELFLKRIRQALRLSLVLAVIYLVFITGKSFGNETIINKVEAEDTLSGKVETLKDEVVATIRKCEGMHYSEEDGLIVFDPDPRQPNKNIASIGLYMYKAKTVQDYVKLLYGRDITTKEAIELALDENEARKLTKDIVFKDKGKGVLNWYNCAKKYNLETKVGLIKQLEN